MKYIGVHPTHNIHLNLKDHFSQCFTSSYLMVVVRVGPLCQQSQASLQVAGSHTRVQLLIEFLLSVTRAQHIGRQLVLGSDEVCFGRTAKKFALIRVKICNKLNLHTVQYYAIFHCVILYLSLQKNVT